jgi:hypothetical protein
MTETARQTQAETPENALEFAIWEIELAQFLEITHSFVVAATRLEETPDGALQLWLPHLRVGEVEGPRLDPDAWVSYQRIRSVTLPPFTGDREEP